MNFVEGATTVLSIKSIVRGATPENIRCYGGRTFAPKLIENSKIYKVRNSDDVLGYGIYELYIVSETDIADAKIHVLYGATNIYGLCHIISRGISLKAGINIIEEITFNSPILDIPKGKFEVIVSNAGNVKIYARPFYYPRIKKFLLHNRGTNSIVVKYINNNIDYPINTEIVITSEKVEQSHTVSFLLGQNKKEYAIYMLTKHIDVFRNFVYRTGGRMYKKARISFDEKI